MAEVSLKMHEIKKKMTTLFNFLYPTFLEIKRFLFLSLFKSAMPIPTINIPTNCIQLDGSLKINMEAQKAMTTLIALKGCRMDM